jgi:hypothetical protein
VYFERYLAAPVYAHFDPMRECPESMALKRVAELYDDRGDRLRAISYYERFIALWQHADPEFQPAVAAARRRVAELRGHEGD